MVILFCPSVSVQQIHSKQTYSKCLPVSVTHAYFTLFLVDLKAVTTCTHFRGEDTGPVHLTNMWWNWDWNPGLLAPSTVHFPLHHKCL